ncbi:MAG: WD40/YVTN/BNR-like repeat-containing protein [Acidimicrobiales bacterium]
MFGHLDDPAGVAPGRRELASVLRRAHGIRVRRRLGALAAALIVIAGAAGLLVPRLTAVGFPSTQTAYQFNTLTGPLAVGTPVPTTALVNAVFDDAQVGFALAGHRGHAVLAESTDGGSTWSVQNDDLPPGYGEDTGYAGQLEFVGPNGYLWGGAPQSDGAVPLWVTGDSGVTWHRAPIGPVVYDVSAIGDNVWALTSSCGTAPGGGSTAGPCALVLQQSLDGGATWSAVASAGASDVAFGPTIAQHVELARITLDRAYILTARSGQPGTDMALVYTADGGRSWQPRPVPCTPPFALGAEVAASGTDDLWFLCGSQASAGSQSKALYRSGDGGFTWYLAASATGLGTPPPPATEPNTLPLGGYIAPFSIGHKNLAVASPTTAWLYPTRATLFETVTGGRSWAMVPGLDTAGFGSGSPGNVTFISATQGWICEYGVGLWHTDDGVHWYPLGV